MKIHTLALHPYQMPLRGHHMRLGVLLCITDKQGNSSWGDIAPLPEWSKETLEESVGQLHHKQEALSTIDWTAQNCLKKLATLDLLPAVSFGLGSALLSLLAPLSDYTVPVSALLMGTPQEILKQAKLRHGEGYTSAKLKVSTLTLEEAAHVIVQLKELFCLRIDVNRAWRTSESLHFFSQFSLDTFDYVEEPFQNPHDLAQFPHPLAVDESFPHDLSLEQLESFPTLKALIYKPTIQGLLGCFSLHKWAERRALALVLSSSFESAIGLAHITSLAYRLSLKAPVGVGTYDHSHL